MKYLLILLAWLWIMPAAFAQSPAESLTIKIIRHGEKNDQTSNLSCKGLHRALLLPQLLKTKFKGVSAIYVPSVTASKSTPHSRMYQTVTPLAIQANLPINTKYGVTSVSELAQDILKRTGMVLVVWEHDNISDLAAALGVKDKLKWPGDDFDSIWTITYTISKKGNPKAQIAADKEGLNPVDGCNF